MFTAAIHSVDRFPSECLNLDWNPGVPNPDIVYSYRLLYGLV